jgi:hypothetical protein
MSISSAARAELGCGQSVGDAGRAEVGGGRRQPDVTGERQAEAASDRRSVDGSDDGLVHPANREDDVVEQLHRPQRDRGQGESVDAGYDAGVLEVGAGTERRPGAGQHDHANAVVRTHLTQRIAQRDHDVERHRVHSLGPIERHQRHSVLRPLDADECHQGPTGLSVRPVTV